MAFRTVGMAAAALLTLAGPARAQSVAVTPSPVLVIRIYNYYGVSGDALDTARQAATDILAETGIEATWVICGRTAAERAIEPPVCSAPPAPHDVMVRIQALGLKAQMLGRGINTVSMGFSIVNQKVESFMPAVSSIYADVVRSVARDAGVDESRLLGLAMAHEIGHLLLNNPTHADAGLMRALWSFPELKRQKAADWAFLSAEADTLRRAVTARNAHLN